MVQKVFEICLKIVAYEVSSTYATACLRRRNTHRSLILLNRLTSITVVAKAVANCACIKSSKLQQYISITAFAVMEVSPNQQQQEEQHVRRSYSKSMQERGTYLDIYIPSGSIGVVCKVSGDNRACEVSEITDKAPKKIRKGDILQSLDGIRLTFDTLLEACVSTVDRINRRLVVFRPEYSPYRDAQNSTTCENSSSIATATTASHKRAMQDAGNRNENEHIMPRR